MTRSAVLVLLVAALALLSALSLLDIVGTLLPVGAL